MAKRLKIGLLCPYPPEEFHQGYYALSIIKNTNADFVKIGTLDSNADYKLNFKSFFLKEKLQEIIQKEKIDLLHIQYIPPFFGTKYLNLNLLRIYSLNMPIVTTLHEVYFKPEKSMRGKWLKFLEKNIVNRSKQIIVHNYMMADFLKKEYKTEKISTIVLGHYLKKEHKRIGKHILFFGILSHGKGVEYLIRAIPYLKDCKLKIMGSIPNKVCEDYKKVILNEKKKINAKNVTIITKKWFSEKERETSYAKADLVILPYTWGPYNSAVVQDAVENLIPVVVTKVGAIYDLVEKFGLGEVVNTKNPKELAKAIRKCFKEYGKYQQNIRRFRKTVNWKENGKNHLVVYKKAIPCEV